ncbi:M56 family metallopeptidase [Clostridium hydrogenum]|uniref:M56 family metallopeptidase n=1 Tax=Clostridium hydrogenum TaxID=2855764 RepID=UPI001F1644BF|nr:M56 family metallopeptidase [Clostridium hydrogenum]
MSLDTVFKIVLNISIMASITALVIFLVKFLFKNKLSSTWHYYIWILVIVRLLMPYSPKSHISIFNILQFSGIYKSTMYNNEKSASSLSPALGNASSFNTTVKNQSSKPIFLKKLPPTETTKNNLNYLINFQTASIIWIIIAASLYLYFLIVYFSFLAKIKKEDICTDVTIIALLKHCKKVLCIKSNNLQIITSTKINTPTLVGIFKPKIILPKNLIYELSSSELKYVILHELIHFKRKDILISWISTALQILHWFNPILLICFKQLKKDCELSCDSTILTHIIIDEHHNYGETLIKLAQIISKPKCIPGTTAIISKSEIKRRIIMISKFKKKTIIWSAVGIILAAVIACVVLTNYSSSSTKTQKTSSTASNKSPKTKKASIPVKPSSVTAVSINPSANSNNTNAAPSSAAPSSKKTNTTVASIKPASIPQAKSTNEASNSNFTQISNSGIINLLSKGDVSLRNSYTNIIMNHKTGNEIDINGRSFIKLSPDIKDYNSLRRFVNQNSTLNNYYTDHFIRNFMDVTFRMVNGYYYSCYGNYGTLALYDNHCSVVSKSYNGNTLTVVLNTMYEDGSNSPIHATLIFNGNNWSIDKTDSVLPELNK